VNKRDIAAAGITTTALDGRGSTAANAEADMTLLVPMDKQALMMDLSKKSDLKNRILRRRVIIRRYDYDRMVTEALGQFCGHTIYDRAYFEPLTRDMLEKQSLLQLLKGKDNWTKFQPTPYPMNMLSQFRDYLYDRKYLNWRAQWDDAGVMWIQSRKNTPRTELGWALFEKDLGKTLPR